MVTRVLIINRQLVFAVTLKQALEQTGTFDVHLFTTADAAFDFLRDHPQDVALVDFTLPGRSGAKVVQQLRGIQPDLAVIVSPRQPDAEAVGSSLGLQGMIDMPFSARDIIPMIEQAVEQAQHMPPGASEAPTLDEGPVLGQTRILGEEDPFADRQYGTTRLLGDQQPPQEDMRDAPAQTRNLENAPQNPYQTRNLDADSAAPSGTPFPGQTRDLSDDTPPDSYLVDDGPSSVTRRPTETRDLDGDEIVSPIKPLRRPPAQTRDMSEDEPPVIKPLRRSSRQNRDAEMQGAEQPEAPPEISSLENVLKSFGFDPPLGEEDTPAVPLSNNEALRQFLATTGNSANVEQFDDVLDSISPDEAGQQSRRETDFDALVKSMKGGEPQRGLPERQQQLLDFVFTSGMDAVLKEIEKTKTGPLPEQPEPPSSMPEEPRERGLLKDSFQKLASEEPPMPSLEEGGTVSDLMLGVSDRGFRNVLSLLRGDKPEEGEVTNFDFASRLERHDRFADYFNPITGPQTLPEGEDPAQVRSAPAPKAEVEPPQQAFNFDHVPGVEDEATVAQVILKAALEELNLPEGFSLNQLLTDIENRLSLHKLNVRPLPSWQMDTSAFRPVTEAEIREPDFLPEELPPGEVVGEEAALAFEEPESFTGHTTRPSLASQQALAAFPVEEDTLFDADFIKETMAPQVVPVQEPETLPETEDLPDWPDAEETSDVAELQHEAAEDVLPDWPSESPTVEETETEGFPMERLEEDTTPSLAFTSEDEAVPEAETVLSGDTWDIRITPDEDEGDAWDETPTAEDIPISGEEQTVFEEALESWSFQAELQETADQWVVQPEEAAVQEPGFVDEGVSAEAYPQAEASWDLPPVYEEAEVIPEDPYIAQLAVNLTQFSLEASSEGTLLTRGDEVIAYAGHLSDEDASELRDAVNNDWDANPEGARIRFITLPSSGKDYMLYSIRTENGFTLSMIFAGTTPLRTIRQQGQKLIAALESIPEILVEEAPPEAISELSESPDASAIVPVETPLDESMLNVYTYVWLLREPEGRLNDAVAQTIMAGLKIQLRELGWSIRTIQVHEDFVYLFAGLPGENPPHEMMRDLKRRSAEIAHAQNPDITPQMLWADAYLILTPGRELEIEEILEFVNFQRMA